MRRSINQRLVAKTVLVSWEGSELSSRRQTLGAITGIASNSNTEKQVERLVRPVRERILTAGHMRRKKRVAEATSFERLRIVQRFLRVLVCELGFQFKTTDSLGERHFRKFATWCVEQGYAPGRLANLHSALKFFYTVVLKKPCLAAPSEYFGQAVKRSHIATVSKNWDDVLSARQTGATEASEASDRRAVIARITERSPSVGACAALMDSLGMRAKESIFFRPHQDFDENAEVVRIREEGSKGGRERFVDLKTLPDEERQRAMDAIALSKSFVTHPFGTVLQPSGQGWRWISRLRHAYYVMRETGVTKKVLGITMHGLRHGFLQRVQAATSGTPVPVSQDREIPALDPSDLRAAAINAVTRLITAEIAGHSRSSVTSTYYGSAYRQWRSAGGSLTDWKLIRQFTRDIDRGEVEALQLRLSELKDPRVEPAALLTSIQERARRFAPRRPYV